MKRDAERDGQMGAPRRALLWLLGVLLISVLLGAALGPAFFNMAVRLGRNVPVLEWLRDVDFERVVSRVVTVSVILLGLLTIRWSGLRGWRDVGYPQRLRWWSPLFLGLVIGVLSMTLNVGLGFVLGAYRLDEAWVSAFWSALIPAFIGALLIGLIEEGFFRGLLFGTFSRGIGYWSAAILSSALFSLAHFLKPENPDGIVYGHWFSGFALVPHMFSRLNFTWHSFPFSLNLFMMGMVLCVFCRMHGDAYFIAGLHAGWVWVLQAGSELFVRHDPEHLLWLFGPSDLASKGWLAFFTLSAFFAVAVFMDRRRGHKERGVTESP